MLVNSVLQAVVGSFVLHVQIQRGAKLVTEVELTDIFAIYWHKNFSKDGKIISNSSTHFKIPTLCK